MHKTLTAIVLPSLVVASLSTTVGAQVPIETRSNTGNPSPVTQQQPTAQPAATQQPDIYYQLQVLEDEVRTLRGTVEELQYQLNQTRQRQMDDYIDLDRRLSRLQGTAPPDTNGGVESPANRPSPAASGNGATAPESKTPPPATDAEVELYGAAYNLLKDGKVNEAAGAFQNYIVQHPAGRYVANAHYWLGEISLVQNNLEEARQSFTVVVENFPNDRKVPDATYKLGTVYHMLGDDARARQLLNSVAAGNSSSAKLAQTYLKENF